MGQKDNYTSYRVLEKIALAGSWFAPRSLENLNREQGLKRAEV